MNPESTNSDILMRRTRIPAWKAASWLSPMAYSDRPRPVMRSMTPVAMARITNTATDHEIDEIPRKPLIPTPV